MKRNTVLIMMTTIALTMGSYSCKKEKERVYYPKERKDSNEKN
jgi:hypothetical protein